MFLTYSSPSLYHDQNDDIDRGLFVHLVKHQRLCMLDLFYIPNYIDQRFPRLRLWARDLQFATLCPYIIRCPLDRNLHLKILVGDKTDIVYSIPFFRENDWFSQKKKLMDWLTDSVFLFSGKFHWRNIFRLKVNLKSSFSPPFCG